MIIIFNLNVIIHCLGLGLVARKLYSLSTVSAKGLGQCLDCALETVAGCRYQL